MGWTAVMGYSKMRILQLSLPLCNEERNTLEVHSPYDG